MSKWASRIVIVPKNSALGEPPKRRLCVDFRKVNELQQEVITVGKTKGQISIHPPPKIDDMYAKLKGAKVFSTIDLRSGYHHIALGKSSRAKIAFVTPFGKYEFLMVPFGLAQAPAYFQLLMNKVLKGLKFAITYLDDIIIFSEHINHRLEWDVLTPMATACYNFFPNCNARESAFFIMFRRDPINKLNMLLHSARSYFHDDNGLLNLEALKNIYQVVAQQLLNSRE